MLHTLPCTRQTCKKVRGPVVRLPMLGEEDS